MKSCNGCNEWGHCQYALFVHILCPCADCIVKIKCGFKERFKCQLYKKFKEKYKQEVQEKNEKTNFVTRISPKKRKGFYK